MHRLYALAVAALILGPNLWATIGLHEDWPFSTLPMFSVPVGPETPRVTFVFVGVEASGGTRRLDHESVGAPSTLMRIFFQDVYGSVEERSAFAEFPNDGPEAFRERLERFFSAFVSAYHRRHPGAEPLRELRLRVMRLGWARNEVIETREIGSFDVASGRFAHTWGRPR